MNQKTRKELSTVEQLRKMIMKDSINVTSISSFRLPRDLTLGGTKPKKKVFKPNLNITRNKSRDTRPSESITSMQWNRKFPNRTVKQVNKRPTLIQSEGLFSQGIGERKKPSFNSVRASVFREENSNESLLPIPIINKGWQNIEKNDEKVLLKHLLAEDSNSESDPDDFSYITLPIESLNDVKQPKELKHEVIPALIKKDSPDNNDQEMLNKDCGFDIKPILETEKPDLGKASFASCLNSSKLYDDDNPAFALFKVPESLPGKVWKDTADNYDISLRNMQDGLMGKILIRKSGKSEVLIKNTKYELAADGAGNTRSAAFLFPGNQSIAMEPSLVALGEISEVISLTPHWDCLFNRAKKDYRF